MKQNRILILFAHPAMHKSRVNSKMIEAVKGMEGITFRNLYEEYPDFQIDIKKEQQLLIDHDLIVWHHPFYWYSAPAILKEWIDLVLEHGFAYGREGKALTGKQVISVITTGGRRDSYRAGGFNQFTINQFLIPFSRTVTLCNMVYLPPFVVHGSHLFEEAEIARAAKDYKKILVTLRDSMFSMDELTNSEYMNDLLLIEKN